MSVNLYEFRDDRVQNRGFYVTLKLQIETIDLVSNAMLPSTQESLARISGRDLFVRSCWHQCRKLIHPKSENSIKPNIVSNILRILIERIIGPSILVGNIVWSPRDTVSTLVGTAGVACPIAGLVLHTVRTAQLLPA